MSPEDTAPRNEARPGPLERSRLRPMTKVSLAGTALLALAAAIFLISSHLASDVQAACRPDAAVIKAFKPTEPPKPVPQISFRPADGDAIPISAFKGRGVVLNFWATWCAPCVREMPELDALHAKVADMGAEVLAVSMDREGHPVIAKFFATNDLKNLRPLHDPMNAAGRALGVRGLPTTVFIDKRGLEVGRIEGIQHYDIPEMVAFVRDCLNQ